MLSERIDELRAEAGKTVDTMEEEENFPDPTDRASMESNRNSMLRMRDRERKLIFKIQEALERLEAGAYGVCEECGEEIGRHTSQSPPRDDAVHPVQIRPGSRRAKGQAGRLTGHLERYETP